ncbi:cyclase family protein [Kitasatospora sp. DSM 101779]|uniref:cyclase family protein n=1 Tax=Kitasatospora sp. DSM 101779 TaxID=2853165 RepID=UPI0021D8AD74|nr:cyclase family protein [Kitasatospora sp. DSM 101779]MCU7821030.1 cyclase family protein [Kitasatospora sp. DSM 101779]
MEGNPAQHNAARLDRAGFDDLYRRVVAAAPAGAHPRGALETITPARVLAAVGEVRTGRHVSLAAPVTTRVRPDNPEPARRPMTGVVAGRLRGRGLEFARDRIEMNVHGDADSHLDALCHVVYNGTLHGGVPATTLTEDGAEALSVELAEAGIVGRGVLLDIPGLRGVPWLEPGEYVTAEELLAAEAAQGVAFGAGDLLFVRLGHRRRRRELGPWDAAAGRAGLHPGAVELLAERRIAVLGSDSNNDCAPSTVDGVGFPVHVLAVHALGVHLLDYLQFEDLLPLCADAGRWSFLCVIAPLRLAGGTGSPVSPIAVL